MLALQNEAQEGEEATKVYFVVNTPVLKQGQLQPTPEDSELQYESVKEVGVWSCYHTAHAKAWTNYMQSNQNNMLKAAGGTQRAQPPRATRVRAVSASRSVSS